MNFNPPKKECNKYLKYSIPKTVKFNISETENNNNYAEKYEIMNTPSLNFLFYRVYVRKFLFFLYSHGFFIDVLLWRILLRFFFSFLFFHFVKILRIIKINLMKVQTFYTVMAQIFALNKRDTVRVRV